MIALRWAPSIGMWAPLMKLARGEARKVTRAATSPGSQMRPQRDGLLGQFVRTLLGYPLVAGERLLQRVPPVGVHRPRVDRVDAHAMPPVLLGDRGREVDVGGIRHSRGHLPVAGLEAVVADHQDDGALAPFAHVADDRAHRADVAHELEVEARHPLVFGQVLQQAAGRAAGAGDQDVDLAEPAKGGVHAAPDVLGHRHVAGHRHDRVAGLGGDLLGGCRQWLPGPGGDDDIGPLAGELLGHRAADPLARAGDEGHLPGQLQVHRNPFRPLPDGQALPPVTGWAGTAPRIRRRRNGGRLRAWLDGIPNITAPEAARSLLSAGAHRLLPRALILRPARSSGPRPTCSPAVPHAAGRAGRPPPSRS